jgi:hypothetical protein
MKFGVVLLTLCALGPALAQHPMSASAVNKVPSTTCSKAEHAHRFSDLRVAIVELTSSDKCGFSYLDLEANTTGPDDHLQYSSDFIVAKAAVNKPGTADIYSEMLTPEALHRGTRGIAFYCRECKQVLTFKVTGP